MDIIQCFVLLEIRSPESGRIRAAIICGPTLGAFFQSAMGPDSGLFMIL